MPLDMSRVNAKEQRMPKKRQTSSLRPCGPRTDGLQGKLVKRGGGELGLPTTQMVGLLTYLGPKCSTSLLGSPNIEPCFQPQSLSGPGRHDVGRRSSIKSANREGLQLVMSETPGAGLRVELYLSFSYHESSCQLRPLSRLSIA
jgi:hypothetical protein